MGGSGRRGGGGRRIRLFPLFAIAVGLLACGENAGTGLESGPDPDPDPDPAGPSFTQVACPDFALAASGGLPLDEISIGAFPPSFALPVAASVSLGDSVHAGFAFIRSPDGAESGADDLRLVVPLHPVEPMSGGPVVLTVSDGTQACAPVEFTVEALPEADGEFESVVDLLQQILAEQAALLDTTPEHLVSTPASDLAPALWPMALTQAVLDHPSNELSLRAVAGGAHGSEAKEWIERILARTALRSALEGAAAMSRSAATSHSTQSSFVDCPVPDYVNTPALLDECMSAAAAADRAANGLSREVADDIGTAFSVVSQLGLPIAGAVESVFGALFWLIYSEREKMAALFPSRFTAMNIEVDKERFAEDEDADGRVTLARVSATSEGYDLQQEIIDGLKQAISLAESTGKFDFSTGTDADAVVSQVEGDLRAAIEAWAVDMEIEAFDSPAELFGPVTVTDPMWIEARIAAGESVELVGETTYEPRATGTSTLSVRTEDGRFGGEQIAEQVEITVAPLNVSISPADTIVGAGDPEVVEFVTFRVTVEESHSPDSVDLDLSEHPRQGEAEIRYVGGNVHEVDYLPPLNPDYGQPDLIVVRHTAEAGARANGPERTAIATVRFGSITITPRTACMEPGEEEQFEATVEGFGESEVAWTASAGDIDPQTGSFTAPDAPGSVIITAELADNPAVNDSIGLTIGGCSCTWSVSVGSLPTFGTATMPDAVAGFVVSGTQLMVIDGNGTTAGGETGSFGLTLEGVGVGAPLGPGTFEAIVSGSFGSGSPTMFFTVDGNPLVTVSLLEASADLVEGSATGIVSVSNYPYDDQNTVERSFQVDFRISPDLSVVQGESITYSCSTGT